MSMYEDQYMKDLSFIPDNKEKRENIWNKFTIQLTLNDQNTSHNTNIPDCESHDTNIINNNASKKNEISNDRINSHISNIIKNKRVSLSTKKIGKKLNVVDKARKSADTNNNNNISKNRNRNNNIGYKKPKNVNKIDYSAIINEENKNEYDLICDICNDEQDYLEDIKVVCRLCYSVTHQTCYGGNLIEKHCNITASWYCQRCEELLNSSATPDKIKCMLCPELKGLMKRVSNTNKDKWVHVECVNLIPEIQWDDSTK